MAGPLPEATATVEEVEQGARLVLKRDPAQLAALQERAQEHAARMAAGQCSVCLAEQGYAVTAVDASAVGLARARELAVARGVRIETIQADLAAWDAPAGRPTTFAA